MRKISKTLNTGVSRNALNTDLLETRPAGLPGATITSWPGALDIDLDALFARRPAGASVTGAAPSESASSVRAVPGTVSPGTVSLSDGTRITFATAGQFDTVVLV